ncbi:MAG: PAS domain S-box protein [Desulfobacteraceae bacterium]|nr:PAS domain S-box protein [Desulfobacteraceae bacterium]
MPSPKIGARLLLYILCIAVLATLLESYVMTRYQQRSNIDRIEEQKEEIKTTVIPILEELLWLDTVNQTQFLLDGISLRSGILKVVLRTTEGKVFVAPRGHADVTVSPFLIPLTYPYKGQDIPLGHLELYFTPVNSLQYIFDHLGPVIVSETLMAFIVAISLFLLFNTLVTKHLQHISKYFEDFDLGTHIEELQLRRRKRKSPDELDVMVSSINSMHSRLTEYQSGQAELLDSLSKNHALLKGKIEEVEKAKDSLLKSELKSKTILERSIEGFWIVAQTGEMLDVNDAACTMLGYSRDEMLSLSIPDIEAKESSVETEKHIEAIIQQGTHRFETRHRHKDGHILDVECSVNYDISLGNVFFSFVRDVSVRKKVEEELRLQAQIITHMAEGVYLSRAADGIIVFTNPESEKIFGYDPGEMLGQHVSVVNAPNPRGPEDTAREILVILENTGAWQGEVENIKKDGTVFWCQAKVYKFRHRVHGEVLVSVHADITAQKEALDKQRQLENKLRQAQKMQSLGTLAGGIAHEFNNFLGIIILNSEMVLDRIPASDPSHKMMARIIRAGEQAKKIISQILTFSRITNPSAEPVLLNQQVTDIVEFIKDSLPSSINIIQQISTEDFFILVETDEIHQILINLCANAVQATPGLGSLTISLGRASLGIEELKTLSLKEGHYAQLSIIDTGTGMDKQIIARACDPFFTTKEVGQGTGMGLSLVYGIMERYHGAIRIESELDKGTAVHLFFPIYDQKDQKIEK